MIHELQNGCIKIKIDSLGAELKSLVAQQTGREYMWTSDPAYWKRSSPILFPFVGRLNGEKYIYEGKTYGMSQHGFARDKECGVLEKKENKVSFILADDEQSRRIYPFQFRLIQEYELDGYKVSVRWKVINTDKKIMYFSIGAHPAFFCPYASDGAISRLRFDAAGPLSYKLLNGSSLADSALYELPLQDGIWSFTREAFDRDAYIFENYQFRRVSILDEDSSPCLTVSFQAPVTGIWSPPHRNAPFICIEPWFGRCDAAGFSGELKDREFGNSLAGGAAFSAQYDIELHPQR